MEKPTQTNTHAHTDAYKHRHTQKHTQIENINNSLDYISLDLIID